MCGSREDAEDLVQETLARVLRKPRILRTHNDLGYLLRALRNTFDSTRRAESRRPKTEPLPERLDLVEDRRAVPAQSRLEFGELRAAICALPGDFRDVLVAVDIVGLSYHEAARALKVREVTVGTRLHRARGRIADAILPVEERPRRR